MIKKALINDIPELEKIMSKAYVKFELDRHYQKYDEASVKNKLQEAMNNSAFGLYKYVNNKNKIEGFLIIVLFPQLYSDNNLQLHDVAIQADPVLSKTKQSKIVITLINFMMKLGKAHNVESVCITISDKFDISKYLINKGFINSGNIFIKGVV